MNLESVLIGTKKLACPQAEELRQDLSSALEPLSSDKPELLELYEERKWSARAAWRDHIAGCHLCNSPRPADLS